MPILGITASSILKVTSSYESIATVTVGSGGAASVTFSSIPQTFTHLQVRAYQKTTGAGDLTFTLNGDTGANYSRHYLYGTGSGLPSSGGTANESAGYIGYSSTGTYFQVSVIDFLDYTSTVKTKSVRSIVGADANGTGIVLLTSSLWFATPAAITTISFARGADFSQYTNFALYGIKGA
jgi:hypothetical protein